MGKRITVEDAGNLLRGRSQLLDTGLTDRMLEGLVREGRLIRVHRGQYVDGATWRSLWEEGRHLLRVFAFARSSPSAVFTHASAAALWGLPLYGMRDDFVHVLIAGSRHSRRAPGVMRHALVVHEDDITIRHGLRCTSLVRTTFDLARTLPREGALAVGDAALGAAAVSHHVQDAERAALWRDDLLARCGTGARGVRQARWVARFADGRAELPGESVSRLRLHQLGFRDVALQVPVTGPAGDEYFVDFGFPGAQKFGEFDGEAKYLEPDLRAASTTAEAVLAEKRREDDVRGVTGWGFARWGHAHIRTVESLGSRLAAFGIHPSR
ncbi:hypothetical protein [Microbacterium sp. CIAB417]|uniref:hypothetical protein n=1 Tax=Microbacterium sp. CIAB417 TaxID=2860287 RepID=UPI001FAD0E72|nr:hypothetical protein [Microbacterium sp. CIAB417]